MKSFVVLLTFVTLTLSAVDSSAIIEYESKIAEHSTRADSLKQLVSESEQKLLDLQQKESSNLKQINEMEQNLELTQTLLTELTTQVDSVRFDMEQAQITADSVHNELAVQRTIMEERLRQMYKSGVTTLPEILFGSSSPVDALNKIRYEHYLNSYDKAIYEKIKEDERRYNTELTILSIQRDYYEELLQEKADENESFATQMNERRKLLESIRSEKEEWEATVQELKSAQQEMNATVMNLIQKRDAVSEELARQQSFNFENRQGKMLWPIIGEVVSSYGKQVHPVHGTVITNKGIGIAGTKGEAIRAVAPGIVEYIDRLPGYGRVLIINHYGGYLTIYAHLASTTVSKGTEVEAGHNIATVGESGSFDGAQLHFEIRKGTETLDPIQWLRKQEL